MRFAIMGVGGVGGSIGAVLAVSGHDVTFIARGQHLAAIQKNGLQIEGTRDIHVNPAKATDDISSLDPVDVVLLTVKLWAIEEAATAIRPIVKSDTAVLTLQNGVDAPDLVASILGAGHVMGGAAEISAAIRKPGIVHQASEYARIRFGELDGRRSVRGKAMLSAFDGAGIEADLADDIEKALWEKFMLLAPLSGLTGATRATFGAILSDPDTRALVEAAVKEVEAVARAKGVDLEANSFEKTMSLIDAVPPKGRASMAIDLEQGNRLELPWLSGAVVRIGNELGLPTPVHKFICTILKLHQDGQPN